MWTLPKFIDSAIVQLVKKPTCPQNIFDLVLTANEDLVNNVEVGEKFGTSDHWLITFEVAFKTACSVAQNESWKDTQFEMCTF